VQVINQHRQWLEGKEVRGRIYISEQGINAQYGGVRRDAEGYARWLADTQPLFKVGGAVRQAVVVRGVGWYE
jgi:predicted sulfurtransferase